jgi:cell division protein FtsB
MSLKQELLELASEINLDNPTSSLTVEDMQGLAWRIGVLERAYADLNLYCVRLSALEESKRELDEAWAVTGVGGCVRGLTELADVIGTWRQERDEAEAEVERLRAENETLKEAGRAALGYLVLFGTDLVEPTRDALRKAISPE